MKGVDGVGLISGMRFGEMVACFRYASIDVHYVHFPPSNVEFNHDNQQWIGIEANGESGRVEELEAMLQKDRKEFQESLKKVLCKEVKVGQPVIDILEINKLRRQILFLSYIWDQRLIHAVGRSLSDGEFPDVEDLFETLEAAWTGESRPVSILHEEDGYTDPDLAVTDMSTTVNLDTGSRASVCDEVKVAPSPQSALLTMGLETTDKELEKQIGARLLLPVGVNDTVVPVYDDEPTSIIAYALVSSDYRSQMSELERQKEGADSAVSSSLFGSGDDSILSLSGPHSSPASESDPLSYTENLHARVYFTDDCPLGKVEYSVTCYYAKGFENLRRICCSSEMDFIRSLSRRKKWDAQGGKSKVFFAKTLDDRFIIKEVIKTELDSFLQFGPAYFKYLSDKKSNLPGKDFWHISGSCRLRYNSDPSGGNKVLLHQNLIEAMSNSPIFVRNKSKLLLERAVWNDTSFLALVGVMDYSLLVGVDEEKHHLVLGIIDFMRQYTWDKHLETWVKTLGILGGPKNSVPTVIPPQQYKKRFRKAMTAYFLMVPD
ncbi:hypothetical protein V6N13_098014 [Hibiscus sabdariffa]